MIDEGLVALVQANAGVLAIAPSGGFLSELQPKDHALPSWTQKTISNPQHNTLTSFTGLTMRRWQVDCYANAGADAIGLARAIDTVLNGFRGVLADPDATYVDHCFRSDLIDFFDPAGRTYRRMLEYEIWFVQN
jgi:hypothetical protein